MKPDLRHPHYEEVLPTLTEKAFKVERALSLHGPCTAIELAGFMNWPVTSVRPRICELRDAGKVESTGERRKKQWVFRITPKQLEFSYA